MVIVSPEKGLPAAPQEWPYTDRASRWVWRRWRQSSKSLRKSDYKEKAERKGKTEEKKENKGIKARQIQGGDSVKCAIWKIRQVLWSLTSAEGEQNSIWFCLMQRKETCQTTALFHSPVSGKSCWCLTSQGRHQTVRDMEKEKCQLGCCFAGWWNS